MPLAPSTNGAVWRLGSARSGAPPIGVGSDAGSLPGYVGRYLSDPRATAPDVRIEFLDYDWSLNDQAPQGEAR